MSAHQVVLCTVPGQEEAERIATVLVERGLAACVNVLPGVLSVYRWEGKTQREVERLMLIKTTKERFAALRSAIVELHPYDVPEVVAVPIEAGHAPYLSWIEACCASSTPASEQG
jgi:periplasmic divalent cation tolerance protein